jgi:hypothetical protein
MEKIRCIENIGSHRWSIKSGRELEYIKWNSSNVPKDIEYQIKTLERNFYDRDCEKAIILFFQSGAGGLFLSNCLSLSSSVCSTLSVLEKITLWHRYLDINSRRFFWNDLYLSNYSPFLFQSHPTSVERPVVMDGYHFVYDHKYENIDLHLDFWNNGNMIYFKNPDLFCKIRKLLKNIDGKFSYVSYEPLLKTKEQYPIPRSFSEFFNLPVEQQNSLKKAYERDDVKYEEWSSQLKNLYVWDTNWYFSEQDTVTHVKELYDFFNLKDFNEKLITHFYRKWIDTLDKLSKTSLSQNPLKFNIKTLLTLLNDSSHEDVPIGSFEELNSVIHLDKLSAINRMNGMLPKENKDNTFYPPPSD